MDRQAVVRAPRATAFTPVPSGLLQRACACDKHGAAGGECTGCRRKREAALQRASISAQPAEVVPPIVHQVLDSPGRPLDAATRDFMEPRFGHDFSGVRVHADARAAASAREVNALAYTVGKDVVFGEGQCALGLSSGRRLLAHELAHVVQQEAGRPALRGAGHPGGPEHRLQPLVEQPPARMSHDRSALRIGHPEDVYEREADAVSAAVMRTSDPPSSPGAPTPGRMERATVPVLQRKLVINPGDNVPLPPGQVGPPTPLTAAVRGLLQETCPDGHFQVNQTTGNVAPENAQFCQQPPPPPPWLAADVSSTPVGCTCICDVINDARTTNIAFSVRGPETRPTRPIGSGKDSPTVAIDPRFQGQYLINGRWVDIPFHLIFAHEVCGHALPIMRGTHVPLGPGAAGGTPPHERHSVDVERQIAAEHNPPLPRRPEDYAGGARQRP